MFCSQCATELSSSDIYCPACSKPVASFAFDGAQVEPIFETPTVVAPSPRAAALGNKALSVAAIVASVTSLLVVGGIAAFFILRPKENAAAVNVDRPPMQTPSPNLGTAVLTPTPTRSPKPTLKPSATETPIDIDKQFEQMEIERLRRENAANANRMANLPPQYPPFDRNGKPLRAVCKNGEPSYWQFDEALTCLTKGGVRYWVRR